MFERTFGIPKEVLYKLSFVGSFFFIYSFTSFSVKPKNWKAYLKTIGIINLLYCCLSLGLTIYLFPKLTIFGFIYFILEIVVIACLAILELRMVSRLVHKN